MKRVLGALLALGGLLLCGFGPAGKPAEEDASDATQFHFDLTRVPLSDLCCVLEKRTGIPHAPADARVPTGGGCGDLTLSALGETTAAELRQAAADALGVAWKVVGHGRARRWVVERVPASLTEEARVVAGRERGFRESLREIVAAASLPEEKRKELPPDLARRVEGDQGAAARLLGALSPADQSRLLAGDTLVYPVSALSPAAQDHLTAIVTGLNDDARRMAGAATLREPRFLDLADGARWSVRITPAPVSLPGTVALVVSVFSPANPGMGSPVNVRVPDLLPQDARGFPLSRAAAPGVEPAGPALTPPAERASSAWHAVSSATSTTPRTSGRRSACAACARAPASAATQTSAPGSTALRSMSPGTRCAPAPRDGRCCRRS